MEGQVWESGLWSLNGCTLVPGAAGRSLEKTPSLRGPWLLLRLGAPGGVLTGTAGLAPSVPGIHPRKPFLRPCLSEIPCVFSVFSLGRHLPGEQVLQDIRSQGPLCPLHNSALLDLEVQA